MQNIRRKTSERISSGRLAPLNLNAGDASVDFFMKSLAIAIAAILLQASSNSGCAAKLNIP